MTVRDVYNLMDEIAPFSLAGSDDNTGLLTGSLDDEVTKILLCLDITREVALEAAQNGVSLIVSHHPVIFNPLYTISNHHPAVILSQNNISAICAHTNLDMAHGGINDIIAKKLGLKITNESLETAHEIPFYQIAVFVPVENTETVYKAMSDAGAGKLGNYMGCAFSAEGTGTFIPLDGSHAYIGEVGNRESVREARLEMIVPYSKRKAVIQAMLDAHPYEKPAYTLYKNEAIIERIGYGKVGELPREMSATELAKYIKEIFGNTVVRYNDTKKSIKTVAFCSGGSGGLVHKAIAVGADAYISGDIKHDQFIDANNSGLAVFDAGHYHTENIVLDYLNEVIISRFGDIDISVAKTNRDIVSYE